MGKSREPEEKLRWLKFCLPFTLGVLLTLAALHLLSAKPPITTQSASAAITNSPAPAPAPANVRMANRGPWGNLELEKLPLENSSEEFSDASKRLKAPRWEFAGCSAQQLTETLRACGFSDTESRFLLDSNHWEPLSNGFAISPSDSLVLGLSADTRQRLYPILARNPANYVQCWPFRFPGDRFEDRFADSGLTPDKIHYLQNLTYTNLGNICLCVDRPLIASLDTNDARCLIRTLHSIPAWLMYLRLDRDSNIDALLGYWGKGGREQKLRPLLESMARRPHGGSVNVSSLLPPFARLRLYTFPDPEADMETLKQDCFYTSLNFFKDPPDESYLDAQNTRAAIKSDYFVAPRPPQFGDVITIVDAAGTGIHACVYIAEEIVFTKNGSNYLQPWTLMRMDDMMAGFPSEEPQRIVIFRHKAT